MVCLSGRAGKGGTRRVDPTRHGVGFVTYGARGNSVIHVLYPDNLESVMSGMYG